MLEYMFFCLFYKLRDESVIFHGIWHDDMYKLSMKELNCLNSLKKWVTNRNIYCCQLHVITERLAKHFALLLFI